MTIKPEGRRLRLPSILRRNVSAKHPRRGRFFARGEDEIETIGKSYSVSSHFEVKRFKPRQRPRMWGGSSSSVPFQMPPEQLSGKKRRFGQDIVDPSQDVSCGSSTRPRKYASTARTSHLVSTSKKNSKPASVRFTIPLISDVWTRPFTPPEDIPELFYSKQDEIRFREERAEWRRRQLDDASCLTPDEEDDQEEIEDLANDSDKDDNVDDDCSVDSSSSTETEDETSDSSSDSESDDDEQPPPRPQPMVAAVSAVPANISAPRSPCQDAAAAAMDYGSAVSAY